VRGLDDGPDGLNDRAFDRALGAPGSSRRSKPARSPQPGAITTALRAPRALDTEAAYDLAAAILADSYGARRDDVEALARWVSERNAAPDEALADAGRDLAAAHQRIAQLERAINEANNAHQVTTLQLARGRAAHGRTANLLLAELQAGIRVHERLETEALDAKLAVAFERGSLAVTGVGSARLTSALDAAELAERERQAVQTAELRGLALGGAL
jgi:hypothetical protein